MAEFRLPALVIEDDATLAESLTDQLREWGFDAHWAPTVADGLRQLDQRWAVILLDLTLPDGSGIRIAEALATRSIRPPVVAVTGTATVKEGFELAKLGVRAYLPKPLNVADLRETLRVLMEDTASTVASLEALAQAEVGSASYQDVTGRVRRALVERALFLAGGNKTGAARILRVSRQAVQQLIRSLELNH